MTRQYARVRRDRVKALYDFYFINFSDLILDVFHHLVPLIKVALSVTVKLYFDGNNLPGK